MESVAVGDGCCDVKNVVLKNLSKGGEGGAKKYIIMKEKILKFG